MKQQRNIEITPHFLMKKVIAVATPDTGAIPDTTPCASKQETMSDSWLNFLSLLPLIIATITLFNIDNSQAAHETLHGVRAKNPILDVLNQSFIVIQAILYARLSIKGGRTTIEQLKIPAQQSQQTPESRQTQPDPFTHTLNRYPKIAYTYWSLFFISCLLTLIGTALLLINEMSQPSASTPHPDNNSQLIPSGNNITNIRDTNPIYSRLDTALKYCNFSALSSWDLALAIEFFIQLQTPNSRWKKCQVGIYGVSSTIRILALASIKKCADAAIGTRWFAFPWHRLPWHRLRCNKTPIMPAPPDSSIKTE